VPDRMSFDAYCQCRLWRLVGFAYSVSGTKETAEDLVQEALARAFPRWKLIQDPDAYLRRSIVHLYISGRRRARREQTVVAAINARSSSEGASPSSALEERDWLRSALADLPPRQRAVLALRYGCGLPDDQIAELVGSTSSSVRSNASRGLTQLRRALRSNLVEPS
jgi:RNA polymerase sigma factor (sigma-70 family)